MEKGRERKNDGKPDRQEEDSERQEYVRQADCGPVTSLGRTDRERSDRQVEGRTRKKRVVQADREPDRQGRSDMQVDGHLGR
jgi:hypothetical protein